MTIHQTLTSTHMEQRVRMAEWLLANPNILDRLWFSDEAHFYLCGHVNSHNSVHWGLTRPDKVLTRPLHSKKVTVWAAVRKVQKPIGPFFFEDENEETVTVNTKNYIDKALKPFWQVLGRRRNIQRDQEWFQQDGTTPNISKISLGWVQGHFNDTGTLF